MNCKRTYAVGDVMILDADRYGHPLIFRPGKLRRIEHHDRVSVLSADKYGHVCGAEARRGIGPASRRRF